jgi:hypothetical protein
MFGMRRRKFILGFGGVAVRGAREMRREKYTRRAWLRMVVDNCRVQL